MPRPRIVPDGPLTVAMIGTRGVPAQYGGFETAIEEIGRRLVAQGHRVVVYSRGGDRSREHLGMERVHLPAVRQKHLETLQHTGMSVLHATLRRRKPDVAFVFNAANAPFLPVLRARRVPTALHMDGLEWKRGKWGPVGQRYYRWSERFGVNWADALIADAPGIGRYYDQEFGVPTELISYGAPIVSSAPTDGVRAMGLEPGAFHLVVARFEPENHLREIVAGYHASDATMPLVVVGSAPYAADYTAEVRRAAGDDPRILFPGAVWDQELLNALYHHAFTYLHGHSVGGTNPSLLRAIGAGTHVIHYDVDFNSEIVGRHGHAFLEPADVAVAVEDAEARPEQVLANGAALREEAAARFDWDVVAADYLRLARRLEAGETVHRRKRYRRSGVSDVGRTGRTLAMARGVSTPTPLPTRPSQPVAPARVAR
jgi:glycosyltransferase involved in cell wall biosynthesis